MVPPRQQQQQKQTAMMTLYETQSNANPVNPVGGFIYNPSFNYPGTYLPQYPSQNTTQNLQGTQYSMPSFEANPGMAMSEGTAQMGYPWDPRFQGTPYDFPSNQYFGPYNQQHSMPMNYNPNIYSGGPNYNPFFSPYNGLN